ncbi:MAG TPA: glycosyltransferase family 4 protein [Candidatus Saccharimonadales bacterium]|jgi:glycosyltransferase involved in cell wall biosynthesis
MISFVWSSKYPFIAGSGGSESYTSGQIRELIRRGIPARIVTIGFGEQDGREDFPDIPFLALDNKEQLSELDDLIVYITYPLAVRTKHQPYAILHCPPPDFAHGDPMYVRKAFDGVKLITASKFAAGIWRRYLKTNFSRMPTVYPFADEAFSTVEHPKRDKNKPIKVLFAGRLHSDKGIYTLLSAMHQDHSMEVPYKLTVTTAGNNSKEGKIIEAMVRAHPNIKVVNSRKNSKEMAKLMAKYDVVVMPSTSIFWQELFGMVSIEAQHAGCRVVASRSGGLPETNVGGLILVKSDDPKALAAGLNKAILRGPLTAAERRKACSLFTVSQSVDSLLTAINYDHYVKETESDPATKRRTLLPRGAQALPRIFGDRLGSQLQPKLALESVANQTSVQVQPATPSRSGGSHALKSRAHQAAGSTVRSDR